MATGHTALRDLNTAGHVKNRCQGHPGSERSLEPTMRDNQGYDIPEEWCFSISAIEKYLCLIPGWKDFKNCSGHILKEISMDPLNFEQSMVIILYSVYLDDPGWGLEQVREDPTEEEAKEDFVLFQKAFMRLVDAAPKILSEFIGMGAEGTINATDSEKELGRETGRSAMGYQFPTGRVRGANADHAVIGGWMTQEVWDKVKYGEEKKLTKEERK